MLLGFNYRVAIQTCYRENMFGQVLTMPLEELQSKHAIARTLNRRHELRGDVKLQSKHAIARTVLHRIEPTFIVLVAIQTCYRENHALYTQTLSKETCCNPNMLSRELLRIDSSMMCAISVAIQTCYRENTLEDYMHQIYNPELQSKHAIARTSFKIASQDRIPTSCNPNMLSREL